MSLLYWPREKRNIIWSITKGAIKFTLHTVKVLFIGSVVLIGSCGFIVGGCSSMARGCTRIIVENENKDKIKVIERQVSSKKNIKKNKVVL